MEHLLFIFVLMEHLLFILVIILFWFGGTFGWYCSFLLTLLLGWNFFPYLTRAFRASSLLISDLVLCWIWLLDIVADFFRDVGLWLLLPGTVGVGLWSPILLGLFPGFFYRRVEVFLPFFCYVLPVRC